MKVYVKDVVRGGRDGVRMGIDPIGTLYSFFKRDYTTIGGAALHNEPCENRTVYKSSKIAGLSAGLGINVFLLLGLPQAISFIYDVFTVVKSRNLKNSE